MIRKIMMCSAILVECSAANVFAADLARLARQGYGVLEATNVMGEFQGCNFDIKIQLSNGLVFVCSGYQYRYAYAPEVLILKHVSSGSIKVLIDGEEFPGSLYRSR